MKIPYKHLVRFIDSDPDIYELSDKLFQLGHDHEIDNDIFDIEFTPNRGDCLSLEGLLRDLKLFYKISNESSLYEGKISSLSFDFKNFVKDSCSKICFLKIEIDAAPKKYCQYLENYFLDLDVKKVNFFTDISNYISYETGQPTHCYDSSKINEPIKLDFLSSKCDFETLLEKTIEIHPDDLAFFDKDNEVINLAGIVGGKKTACSQNTKSVIVECAHFDPEVIIGKSVRYDINSEAAHKFERGTDPRCHEHVLRRFLRVVEDHVNILKIELFIDENKKLENKTIPFKHNKINKILGTQINEDDCKKYLEKLGFKITNKIIQIPSYRNDVSTINDISEEIARAIGYDNIPSKDFAIDINSKTSEDFNENKIKKLLIKEGFYEVINNPFVNKSSSKSVTVDNPLDSERKFLRTSLKESLIENLLYNERRQKDSVKLFEISDIYEKNETLGRKAIGIIASGRVGKDYLNFSKQIDIGYLEKVINKHINCKCKVEEISRDFVNSKLKNKIVYVEIDINSSLKVDYPHDNINIQDIASKKYIPISEFPSSYRDISFSVKNYEKCKILEELILNFNNSLLKDVFVFDYYRNEKMNIVKIGFRFIFQSKDATITDDQVNDVMDSILSDALTIDSVSIPGLSQTT